MRQTPSRSLIWGAAFVIVALLTLGLTTGRILASQPSTPSSSPGVRGTLTPRAWLPLVMRNHQVLKARSVIHLGNRSEDWNATLLRRLEYKTDGSGIWPAAVVVLSDQLWGWNRKKCGRETRETSANTIAQWVEVGWWPGLMWFSNRRLDCRRSCCQQVRLVV